MGCIGYSPFLAYNAVLFVFGFLCLDLLRNFMDTFIGQRKSLLEIEDGKGETDHGNDRHGHAQTGLACRGNTERPVNKLVRFRNFGTSLQVVDAQTDGSDQRGNAGGELNNKGLHGENDVSSRRLFFNSP